MSQPQFLKSYDDLLDNILTAYKNLDPSPDVTSGSIAFIKSACLASMLWGLYKYQEYVANQIFPDTCDTDNLNHHGGVLGIVRDENDTDETYRTKILNFLRQPPAGGNKLDYQTWASQTPGATGGGFTGIATVATTTVVTPDDGLTPGNLELVIMPNDITMLGTTGMQNLVTNCYTYVDAKRPVTANQMGVFQPTPTSIYPSINVTAPQGVTLDTDLMKSDIQAFFNGLLPGDPVYISKLEAICIQDGAVNAVVTSPPFDQIPSKHNILVAGSINVYQV